MTSTIPLVVDEVAKASEKKEEQGRSDDNSFDKSEQTFLDEDNSNKFNVPTNEDDKEPITPFGLSSTYFNDLLKFSSTIKMKEAQAMKRKYVFC